MFYLVNIFDCIKVKIYEKMLMKMKTNIFFRKFVTKVKHPPEKGFRHDNEFTQTSQKLLYYQDIDLENNTNNVMEEILEGNIRGNSQVIKVLKETGDVDINHIPSVCLTKKQSFTSLYLLNKNTAKEFASIISNDILKSNVPIVEINAGPGFLTEELLKLDVSKIYIHESHKEFHWYLQPLLEKYDKQLELRNYNLLRLNNIENLDTKLSNQKIQNIFKDIKIKQWNEEPSMQIITAIPSKTFLHELFYSMMDRYLSNFGRIILYIATKPSIAKIFEDNLDTFLHTPKNIFLKTLFDHKVLGSLPRESFFPLNFQLKKKRRKYEFYSEDEEKMSILRLEAKEDFLSNDFTRRDAVMFLYFLKSHMRRRDARIIPELEKLMPGCGRQLIRHNLNIYSRFSELTSYQLLILFKIIKSWAQFKNSSFMEDLKFHLGQET